MNSSALKSSKFIKFLRECGLIKHGVLQNHALKSDSVQNRKKKSKASFTQLSTVQADLIFKKLTGARKPRGHQLVSIALIKQEGGEQKKGAKI